MKSRSEVQRVRTSVYKLRYDMDTVYPITVRNFRFLHMNYVWMRAVCFVVLSYPSPDES